MDIRASFVADKEAANWCSRPADVIKPGGVVIRVESGQLLYAIDADSRRIFGWSVGGDGSLAPVGSWAGLPATVAGLAAA